MTAVLEQRTYLWATADLAQGLEALISATGRPIGRTVLAEPPTSDQRLTWLVEAPRSLGLSGSVAMVEKDDLLATLLVPGTYIVPADVLVDGAVSERFVAAVSDGMRCRVVGRHGAEYRGSTVELVDFVLHAIADHNPALERIFASLPGGERVLARIVAKERLVRLPLPVVSYHPDAASSLGTVLRGSGGSRDLVTYAVAMLAQITVVGSAALTLGNAVLDGLVDRDRVIAWTMISLVAAPLSYVARMNLMRLTLGVAGFVKRRALEGTFFLSEDTLRREGYGANIARMNETSLLERIGIADALGVLVPLAMIGASIYLAILANRHAVTFVLLEMAILLAFTFASVQSARLELAAYAQRTRLSGEVVEKILGHRTRAVQEHPSLRHNHEDRELSHYTVTLRRLDAYNAFAALVPRLWVSLGGMLLSIEFVTDGAAAELVLSGSSVVLLGTALSSLALAAKRGAMMWAAWRAVRELLSAGTHRPRPERPLPALDVDAGPPTVLAASSLAFSYRLGGKPVLQDVSLRVQRGERVLLEGSSGGGKTTLVKILAGELRPGAGSVLVSGLDPFSGSETQWRELVASVPQFHENHLFSQTFAFNVDPISGRNGLSREAAMICAELELGPVLSRMPARGAQLLGETGWQLSHGERSRVFIARALLQKAKLVILDESFAALDPTTMQTVIACVRRHAGTLLVIAHV